MAGEATSASLAQPTDVVLDLAGNLYIADTFNNRIRKVSPTGVISTVAGTGPTSSAFEFKGGGFSGDAGPATSASLGLPIGVTLDATGNLYIADTFNNRIRKVSSDGTITTLGGNGLFLFAGDGGPPQNRIRRPRRRSRPAKADDRECDQTALSPRRGASRGDRRSHARFSLNRPRPE